MRIARQPAPFDTYAIYVDEICVIKVLKPKRTIDESDPRPYVCLECKPKNTGVIGQAMVRIMSGFCVRKHDPPTDRRHSGSCHVTTDACAPPALYRPICRKDIM